MFTKQHTIASSVSIEGMGLHTGLRSRLTFNPAPENSGIVFFRTDIEGAPAVPADVEYVKDTRRGTVLSLGEATVHTVEHVLSALSGLQIDNVHIQLDGPEPPIMDGSAQAYIELLKQAGLQEQDAAREIFKVETLIHFADPESGTEYTIFPSGEYQVAVTIDYDSDVLHPQRVSMENIGAFEEHFSPARTFCFLHELEGLVQAGLVKGGDLDNALVLVDKPIDEATEHKLKEIFQKSDLQVTRGILNNTPLRFPNEPARHKLLDLVGDLTLAGMPIQGRVVAWRPGHKSNVELAKRVKAEIKKQRLTAKYQPNKPSNGVVFDINAIQNILPHRYPFLLIDKIISFSESSITGIKNVTINEPFFQGHFEGNPIMPGVLQLEAMAQVGGILLLNSIEDPKSVWVYFVAIDNARFKKPVIPGDTIVFELEMTALRRGICKMSGKAYVDGVVACEADLVASLVPKNKS